MPTTPLRARIRNEIAALAPFDVAERGVISDVLDWLDSGAAIFRLEKPATPPKHLVSYFVLVDGELVDHIKSGLWLPPAGMSSRANIQQKTVGR